jgi:hypothetical protein
MSIDLAHYSPILSTLPWPFKRTEKKTNKQIHQKNAPRVSVVNYKYGQKQIIINYEINRLKIFNNFV